PRGAALAREVERQDHGRGAHDRPGQKGPLDVQLRDVGCGDDRLGGVEEEPAWRARIHPPVGRGGRDTGHEATDDERRGPHLTGHLLRSRAGPRRLVNPRRGVLANFLWLPKRGGGGVSRSTRPPCHTLPDRTHASAFPACFRDGPAQDRGGADSDVGDHRRVWTGGRQISLVPLPETDKAPRIVRRSRHDYPDGLLVQRRPLIAPARVLGRHLAVLEARVLLQEGQLDLADGAVALLGDVHLGDALLLGVLGVAVLVAVEYADDVRVLLDCAGFAKVREPRHGRRAALDLAVQLRERHHREVQLLGERLQGARYLRDLLLAVVPALARPHELDVVDDHEPELRRRVALEPPRLGAQLEHGARRRVIDVDGRVAEPPRGHGELRKLTVGEVAGAHARQGAA